MNLSLSTFQLQCEVTNLHHRWWCTPEPEWTSANSSISDVHVDKLYPQHPQTGSVSCLTLRHSDGVSHTAAMRRKQGDDSAKNVMANDIEVVQ